MALRICAVFHSDKQDGAAGKPPAVAVNPPMTMAGMEKIDSLVAKIKNDSRLTELKCGGIYSSRLARALDAASVFALHFDQDIRTLEGLGQMANKEGDEVIKYPGHEAEDVVIWQVHACSEIQELYQNHFADYDGRDAEFIVLTGHRPIIGGLVAWARGVVGDRGALDRLIKDPELVKDGYVVLDYDPDADGISEVPL
ncbi:MAG: hypothetical protein HYT46_00615 [Candidatus Vogelbacteria bacterium]|nr:hypothetical protein [Candidatus Vogelbacteria bacterium]